MKKCLYEGWFQIVGPRPPDLDPEEDQEAAFEGWITVEAESEDAAREAILAEAHRRRWKPRKDRQETAFVRNVWLVTTEPRVFYGFRFGGATLQTARYHGFSNIDYVPGQLYAFEKRKERDSWVQAGDEENEIRRVVRANSLPAGWRTRDAHDPSTEEPSELVATH